MKPNTLPTTTALTCLTRARLRRMQHQAQVTLHQTLADEALESERALMIQVAREIAQERGLELRASHRVGTYRTGDAGAVDVATWRFILVVTQEPRILSIHCYPEGVEGRFETGYTLDVWRIAGHGDTEDAAYFDYFQKHLEKSFDFEGHWREEDAAHPLTLTYSPETIGM